MGGVSAATRARIKELMERVDYHPSISARTLRGRQNACVGVALAAPPSIVPLSQHFFIWLFERLYRLFSVRGEYVCFDLNPYAFEGEGTSYTRGVLEHLYKACVIIGPLAVHDRAIHRVHQSGVPYVALGRLDSLPECSCATVDYDEGTYISTRYLIERGHRRIAMLKGFQGFQPGEERQRGYVRAMEEAGLTPDESLVRSVTFGSLSIASMIYRLLEDRGVTGLVDCSASEDAASIREGLRLAGRVPGKDVELVTWTYSENRIVLQEAAAHVWLPVRESTAEGLDHLASWLDGNESGPIKVVYRPVLFTSQTGAELSKPEPLFELLK
jgi:DNA-binding LacI/PurR family transcriptional regulator